MYSIQPLVIHEHLVGTSDQQDSCKNYKITYQTQTHVARVEKTNKTEDAAIIAAINM
jgi:hypothetical protein